MDPSELEIVRRAFAKQVLAAVEVSDARVEAAFATVRREYFLGPGPWPVLRWRGPKPLYATTPSNLNNGEPSLHAALIADATPRSGEHVVHIGAGVGYYTAILAALVGASGTVTAIELDPRLASRAAANFSLSAHVRVVPGDATQVGSHRPM